jgi:YidC/Oxa1 family membrane protein insertase
VKDYGWLTILAKPLYWLLTAAALGFIGNWGWSIMALVLLIKIAFYWLQAKGYESMAKMKAINPKVMAMRERYKDNPQQMQQEMMRIYKEEKVNPLGGCLPIMVQIPVFIALYWVLLSSVEMRNAPVDRLDPRPVGAGPVLHPAGVMTLTTLLQTALNPVPPDPMQAKMMWIMPLAFSVMFFFFPAGLVLYWITNNVLSIAQQWLINEGRFRGPFLFAGAQRSCTPSLPVCHRRVCSLAAHHAAVAVTRDPQSMLARLTKPSRHRPPAAARWASCGCPAQIGWRLLIDGGLRPRPQAARGDLPAVPGRRRQHHRPGPGHPLPGAELLHRRRRA